MRFDPERSLVSTRSILGGVAGGLLHAGVAVFLWHYFAFDNLWELLAIKPLNGVYIVLGAFALGFVPAALYAGQKFVSPAVLVGALFALSGVASWQALPAGAPRGAPTPFGVSVLLWVGVLALAGLAGVVERNLSHRAAER